MLGNAHFYNRTIRKIVVAFGTLFNDITLYRYNKAGTTKYEHFKVPLSYGSKERYLTLITSDPTLTKSIATLVPRISFEMSGMTYDSSRKQPSVLQNFSNSNSSFKTQYVPIPYDFNFSLSIYARNTEDATQIVEQILPFFTPDFTVTVDLIPSMDQKYDMPIILNSINTTTDYEGSAGDGAARLITWDLDFTVKGYIFPPVKNDAKGLIGAGYTDGSGNTSYGSAIINVFTQGQDKKGQKVYVDYANGSNVFATGEIIRVNSRDIYGEVAYFSNSNNGILIVKNMTDFFEVGDVIKGDYTNAKYTITRVDKAPLKSMVVTTTSDPLGVDPDDEYGFSFTLETWPDTMI